MSDNGSPSAFQADASALRVRVSSPAPFQKGSNMEKKFKILRVTLTQDYIIEMFDDEISHINGWTIEEIVEDWFKKQGADGYHATREGSQIGNSRKYIKHELVDIRKK